MAPHRNVPSATPSMKTAKPERTLRSHEENQERAYIAASRRSDRSLEARVESARRASDIHKKRTGRALRVTEQDVMNEEMYEEEDDDIPWRYRSVTSHLPLEDGLLSRRLQSMLAVQLENQRLLGQAVNSTLQHNPQFQQQGQFVSPGMMQMPQMGFQNSMLPPQQLNRTSSGYRQSPYPLQQAHSYMKPSPHQRSASIATPQDFTGTQHYHQSNQSALQNYQQDARRMSLPQGAMASNHQTAARRSPSYQSQHGSTPSTPLTTYQQASSTSPDQSSQHPPAAVNAGSVQQNGTPAQETNNPFAPFTTSLPMETQQLLAGADSFPGLDMFGQQQQEYIKPQQPFYSYRPNGSSGKNTPKNLGGLNQTLLGNSIDTGVANNQSNTYVDTPTSAYSAPLYSAGPESGFGFGYDNIFSINQFGPSSGYSSGQVTPGNGSGYNEPLFNDFLDSDMFNEAHTSYT